MSLLPRLPLPFRDFQALEHSDFVALLGPVVEHSAWVAAGTWNARPFQDWNGLLQAMTSTLKRADAARQLSLLRAHPELAGQEALAGTMTAESQSEQGRLGLHCLTPQDFQRLTSVNQRYQARFGFPFIVALRLHASLDSVFGDGEDRLRNPLDVERGLALAQVIQVMRGRLANTVSPDGLHDHPNPKSSSSSLP